MLPLIPAATRTSDETSSEVDLILDPRLQPRIAVDNEVAREYAHAMMRGDIFPPVVVYAENDQYYLADGWHRYEASRIVGRETITARVRIGTIRDAVYYSASANATHGLPRTNADKRRAVLRLLMDDEWQRLTDKAIGNIARVSDGMVNKVRIELQESGDIPVLTQRIGVDGRLIDVSAVIESNRRVPTSPGFPKDDHADPMTAKDEFDNEDEFFEVDAETGEVISQPVSPRQRSEEAKERAAAINEATPEETAWLRSFDGVANLIPLLQTDPRDAIGVATRFRKSNLVLLEERLDEIEDWLARFLDAARTAQELRDGRATTATAD